MTAIFNKCPFCGSDVSIMTDDEKLDFADHAGFRTASFHFNCSNKKCLLGAYSQFWETNWESEEVAAEAWNMRTKEGKPRKIEPFRTLRDRLTEPLQQIQNETPALLLENGEMGWKVDVYSLVRYLRDEGSMAASFQIKRHLKDVMKLRQFRDRGYPYFYWTAGELERIS